MVEAAIVIPVLFLIVALILAVTVRTCARVGDVGTVLEDETAAWAAADPMATEGVMRLRWYKASKTDAAAAALPRSIR